MASRRATRTPGGPPSMPATATTAKSVSQTQPQSPPATKEEPTETAAPTSIPSPLHLPAPAVPPYLPPSPVPVQKKNLWKRYVGYRYFDDPAINRYPRGRPSLMRWTDWLLLVLTWAILACVHRFVPSNKNQKFSLADAKLAYPYEHSPLPLPYDGLSMVGIPLLIISLLSVLWIRSFWDFHNAVTGLAFAVTGGQLLSVNLKKILGGLRPYFFDVCQPTLPEEYRKILADEEAGGMKPWWKAIRTYDSSICQRKPHRLLDETYESFPSGHAVTAFAAFVFLSCYLNGKLKVWRHRRPSRLFRMSMVASPIGAATAISGLMVRRHQHHFTDVVFGALVGIAFGLMAYPMMFDTLLDSRRNHIPLLRLKPQDYPLPASRRPSVSGEVGGDDAPPARQAMSEQLPQRLPSGQV